MGNVIINDEELIDNEYSAKCEEYARYIDEHVLNVKAAFMKLFRNPDKPFTEFHGINGDKLEAILNHLEININGHDSSKYVDEEFGPYRTRYYPTTKEKERMATDDFYAKLVESEYEMAVKHHYITNDHHPEHWKWIAFQEMERPVYNQDAYGNVVSSSMEKTKTKIILKMPREEAIPMKPAAILHMICDWEAMSMKFQSDTVDWYISDRAKDERNSFHPKTRVIVEELLFQLYGREIPKTCPGDKKKG